MLYRLALETGLRASEIRSLTLASFDLIDENGRLLPEPTVTVAAAYSKRRREDVQPIRPSFAKELLGFLKNCDPTAPLLPLPKGDHLSRLIKA